MVQAMEAWLLADRDALRRYFGRAFNENSLPNVGNLEDVTVRSLETSLRTSSSNCSKQYSKGPTSFEILAVVNANHVAARCQHAKSLLDYIRFL